ncbi:hypothetical protein NLG97_g2040 [Lecanicillium saksenae]|uniref:Uncharacterized protein n=1 Tax=Lecanicillium saksenae TaxID=468837 RepID=A0ACC1R3X2_9HYPO|nr:hypothetical protein NLG97_g2040 [Lecanicillium saksenae]
MPVASSLQTPSKTSQHVETCSVALELGAEGGRVSCAWNGKPELLPSDSTQHSCPQVDDDIYSKLTRDKFAIVQEMLECILSGEDGTDCGCIKAMVDVMYIHELRMVIGITTDEKKLRQSFPVLDKFFQLYEKLPSEDTIVVASHVQQMLLEHLGRLHEAARQASSRNRCNIKNLISAFPSGWTSWRQTYVTACLQIVWDLPSENVLLIHEFQAIANYNLCRVKLSKKASQISRKMLLVSLDAYALSVSTIFVQSDNRNPAKLHLINGKNDAYVHSGVYQHATRVRAAIRKYIQTKRNIPKNEEKDITGQFMASYQATWGATTCKDTFTIRAASSSGVPHEICFNDREARQMYNTCFAHIFKILEKYVKDQEATGNDKTEEIQVVLTGSGFTNAHLRSDVEGWAKKWKMRLHDSDEEGFETYKAGSVAVGAAYAILNSCTVEELMRTACFAIRNSLDNKNSDLIIWRNNSPVSCRLQFLPLEAEEMSVLCSPCPETGAVISIDIASSYEIFKLRTLKPGDYDVRMEYTKSASGHADQVRIVFEDIRCPTTDGDDVQVLRSSCKFQIYFDCGSRLCFQEIDTPESSNKWLTCNAHPEEPEPLRSVTHEDLQMRIRAHMAYRSGYQTALHRLQKWLEIGRDKPLHPGATRLQQRTSGTKFIAPRLGPQEPEKSKQALSQVLHYFLVGLTVMETQSLIQETEQIAQHRLDERWLKTRLDSIWVVTQPPPPDGISAHSLVRFTFD